MSLCASTSFMRRLSSIHFFLYASSTEGGRIGGAAPTAGTMAVAQEISQILSSQIPSPAALNGRAR